MIANFLNTGLSVDRQTFPLHALPLPLNSKPTMTRLAVCGAICRAACFAYNEKRFAARFAALQTARVPTMSSHS